MTVVVQLIRTTQIPTHSKTNKNRPCRDLSELRHLVALLFPRYLQPVRAGEVRRDQTRVLYVGVCHVCLADVFVCVKLHVFA